MQHVLWYDKVHHDLLLGNKLLKIRGRAVRLISPFPSLRLLMSAFCWFALMPHVAVPCISCIIPRTPSKDREDGRWQSGPAPRRALRLEGYYTFFFLFAEVHCYSACAPCGSSRSLRQRGRITLHFLISVSHIGRMMESFLEWHSDWVKASAHRTCKSFIWRSQDKERQSGTMRQSTKCSPAPFQDDKCSTRLSVRLDGAEIGMKWRRNRQSCCIRCFCVAVFPLDTELQISLERLDGKMEFPQYSA